MRSQLAEFGVITAQGYAPLRRCVVEVLSGEHCHFQCGSSVFVIQDLYEEWQTLDCRIKAYDQQIMELARHDVGAQRLMSIPGVGPLTASAIVGKVHDFSQFTRAANFSAWLGLTPKEYSSAEKRYWGRISKQGDRYIRTLLIHGARASLRAVIKNKEEDTSYHRWIRQLLARVGHNKTVVALANKHARMVWALMTRQEALDLNFSQRFETNVHECFNDLIDQHH